MLPLHRKWRSSLRSILQKSILLLQSPINRNNPAPSHQPGPYSTMLSDHLFEADLPKSNSFESNILAASESIVIKSLAQMREGVIHKAGGKGKDSHKKREPSKRKKETSPVLKQNSEQGLGTKQNNNDKEVNKKMIVDNLRLQKVLGGRVFDIEILTKPGMDSLADLVEFQSWTHKFMTKYPVLHKEHVQDFYCNVEFVENSNINTWIENESLHLDEELLGKILEVPREGTRFIVGKSCTKQFVKECSKLPDIRRAGVQKKLLKGEYQLLFEFFNKVLLPRTEKRTVASATNLFVMESLCKFEPLNLPALILDHMYKTVIEH
ncbi:hypothetical protein H5410_031805 [Solanum commersonii]|uniref:Uncharacterized protein n=1 Tax=Solanum commersonii TaxID=4109 RepID=A0A9J5YI68_SOLCO|nr:hypothetical protein H5410_031805 [Solanum commersonii]